tara:strand:+ start:918 stop:1310 length:393 start_codon:yes stop_codon:yes gene_type:complete
MAKTKEEKKYNEKMQILSDISNNHRHDRFKLMYDKLYYFKEIINLLEKGDRERCDYKDCFDHEILIFDKSLNKERKIKISECTFSALEPRISLLHYRLGNWLQLKEDQDTIEQEFYDTNLKDFEEMHEEH